MYNSLNNRLVNLLRSRRRQSLGYQRSDDSYGMMLLRVAVLIYFSGYLSENRIIEYQALPCIRLQQAVHPSSTDFLYKPNQDVSPGLEIHTRANHVSRSEILDYFRCSGLLTLK